MISSRVEIAAKESADSCPEMSMLLPKMAHAFTLIADARVTVSATDKDEPAMRTSDTDSGPARIAELEVDSGIDTSNEY